MAKKKYCIEDASLDTLLDLETQPAYLEKSEITQMGLFD